MSNLTALEGAFGLYHRTGSGNAYVRHACVSETCVKLVYVVLSLSTFAKQCAWVVGPAAVAPLQRQACASKAHAVKSRNRIRTVLDLVQDFRMARGGIPGCKASPLAAVIIEPRRMERAMAALDSVLRHAPKETCIVWFAGSDNEAWVREQPTVQLLTRRGRFELRQVPQYAATHKLGVVSAPNMFTHPRHSLPSELVLTFQSDTLLCSTLDLARFGGYAQVGAPWRDSFRRCMHHQRNFELMASNVSLADRAARGWRNASEKWCPESGVVGNSGLSLRNRSWMLRAISACPQPYAFSGLDTAPGQGQCYCPQPAHPPLMCREDYYFASVLTGLNAPMPSRAEAAAFAVETSGDHLSEGALPVGVHALSKWHHSNKAWYEQLRAQCEDFQRVFSEEQNASSVAASSGSTKHARMPTKPAGRAEGAASPMAANCNQGHSLEQTARLFLSPESSNNYEIKLGGADKYSGGHDYLRFYQKVLQGYSSDSNVLELGVRVGDSLMMWAAYFCEGFVFGVDISLQHWKRWQGHLRTMLPTGQPSATIAAIEADATQPSILSLLDNATHGHHLKAPQFDIIIDDASHKGGDMISSFQLLFPKALRRGGVYILEDAHWGFPTYLN